MQNQSNDDVIEIDMLEIFGLLWSRLWLIVICAVLAGGAGFGISRFLLTEQFESTTRIYVLNRQNDNALTYSDVQLGTQLTKDFAQIIKSRHVMDEVIKICGIPETSDSLAKRIDVVTQSDTRIVSITVTDPNPKMAQYLADEVRKVAADRIKGVMDIQAVNLVDEANLPVYPSSPKVARWTLVGMLLGAFLCAAVILAHFMMDDTIKTSDDVERYLGLSVLGMVPTKEETGKEKHGKGGGSSGRGNPGSASAGSKYWGTDNGYRRSADSDNGDMNAGSAQNVRNTEVRQRPAAKAGSGSGSTGTGQRPMAKAADATGGAGSGQRYAARNAGASGSAFSRRPQIGMWGMDMTEETEDAAAAPEEGGQDDAADRAES